MHIKTKRDKIIFAILLIAAIIFYGYPLVVLLSGYSYDIPLQQPAHNISEIILLDTSSGEERPLHIIPEEERETFASELMQIQAGRYVNDPSMEYGALAVKICYEDGACDIVGVARVSSFLPSGEETGKGWYYVKEADLVSLFSKYVDPDILPE